MNIDLSLTITGIIALCAIVSPIVTALISNCHQTKLKKLDMYEEAKRKSLSDFIDSAQATIFNSDDADVLLEYTSNFDKLFIYFSDFSLETIKPFEDARVNLVKNSSAENLQIANRELSRIVFNLSKQIKKK